MNNEIRNKLWHYPLKNYFPLQSIIFPTRFFFQIFQKQKEGEIQNRIFVRGLHTNFKYKVLGNNGSRSDGNNYWLHHIKSLIAGVK